MVDHNVIINELENLQVHPVLVRWIKAFLTNREHCVKIDSHQSPWTRVNGGLPQGTRLGPLVNPLLKDWIGRLKFVDDTTALEISIMLLIVDEIFHHLLGWSLTQENVKK